MSWSSGCGHGRSRSRTVKSERTDQCVRSPVATGEACGRSRPRHASDWFKFNHTRLAFVAFGVVEAIAFFAYVLLGRRLWFWADEWDFLAARTAGDLGDLLRPHGNVHPSTF